MHEWMGDNHHTPHIVVDAGVDGARFSGVPFDVWVPMRSVMGIYARETGQGMIFSHDSDSSSSQQIHPGESAEPSRKRAHLTVVIGAPTRAAVACRADTPGITVIATRFQAVRSVLSNCSNTSDAIA